MRTFKILRCPFCSGHPNVSMCVDYTLIFCGCGATGPHIRDTMPDVDRLQKAVEHWNFRIDLSEQSIYEKYIDHTHKEWNEH